MIRALPFVGGLVALWIFDQAAAVNNRHDNNSPALLINTIEDPIVSN